MPSQFITIPTNDEIMARVQQNIRVALDPISRDLLLNRSMSAIKVTIAGVNLSHNLGRQPIGWIVIDKDAQADIWRVAWTSTTITLKSSADVTAKIIFF